MNKEQQEIIDDALKRYWKEGRKEVIVSFMPLLSRHYNREEFINKCKTDTEFSEKWGLKIEERDLSLEERALWLQNNKDYDLLVGNLEHDHIREVVENESPTKLITVTRELSRDERIDLYNKEYGILGKKYEPPFDDFIDAKLTTRNIPTTKTIESYEN